MGLTHPVLLTIGDFVCTKHDQHKYVFGDRISVKAGGAEGVGIVVEHTWFRNAYFVVWEEGFIGTDWVTDPIKTAFKERCSIEELLTHDHAIIRDRALRAFIEEI